MTKKHVMSLIDIDLYEIVKKACTLYIVRKLDLIYLQQSRSNISLNKSIAGKDIVLLECCDNKIALNA